MRLKTVVTLLALLGAALWPGASHRGLFGFQFGPTIEQPTAGAPPSQLIAVRAERLFDGNSDRGLPSQVVLIQGDRISDVGPSERVKIPPGAEVIDLSRATVLLG